MKTRSMFLAILTSASCLSIAQPSFAWDWVGEGVQIFKDNAENIRSRAGKGFDQKFMTYMPESEVQALKARYGGDWQSEVDSWCNNAVSKSQYAGRWTTIPGINSTWRAHGSSSGGQGIDCFARVRNF